MIDNCKTSPDEKIIGQWLDNIWIINTCVFNYDKRFEESLLSVI